MIGCSALPERISCSAVLRTWSLGMAKPADVAGLASVVPGTRAMAELIPITWPCMSSSGPPELPG